MSLPPSYSLLGLHPNEYYFETGCWNGDSLDLAVQSKAFRKIIGIERDEARWKHCSDRFRFDPRVDVYQGDSAFGMSTILNGLKAPITFFLDAHYSLLEWENPNSPNLFPLLKELDQIADHSGRFLHTIIIDDILHLTHPDVTGWTRETIECALRLVNPNFKIQYIANPIVRNMIIATP